MASCLCPNQTQLVQGWLWLGRRVELGVGVQDCREGMDLKRDHIQGLNPLFGLRNLLDSAPVISQV